MALLEEEKLEKAVGGEVIPESSTDPIALNSGICCHCGGTLQKFLEINVVGGSDTSYVCLGCTCQYVHHVSVYQKTSYWMDNGPMD